MGEPVRELEIEVFASDPVFELRHNGQVYSRFPQLDASVFHLELMVADPVVASAHCHHIAVGDPEETLAAVPRVLEED